MDRDEIKKTSMREDVVDRDEKEKKIKLPRLRLLRPKKILNYEVIFVS